MSATEQSRSAQLSKIIADDFYNDRFDLSERGVVNDSSSWSRMPEVRCVEILRNSGVPERALRLFLTFVAAMDRARDATRLWNSGLELFKAHPELFEPYEVAAMPLDTLRVRLSTFGVSQRHNPDSNAWRDIANSLVTGYSSPVCRVIEDGLGNAEELLKDLRSKSGSQNRFPMLRGPKIGPMWVRMIAAPGGAVIEGINTIPVAVDVQVRRVTRNLGVLDLLGHSSGSPSTQESQRIQSAWHKAVQEAEFDGPRGIAGTCAALDPAIWFFGKHGCSHCENVGRFVPISRACESCQLFTSVDESRDG